MTAPAGVSHSSAVFGAHRWDLRYSHSALRCIQMVNGSLHSLANNLLGKVGAAGLTGALSEDVAALLVWAGQCWCEKKLTLEKTKRRLAKMTDMERQLLTTWAAADFLTAVLGLLEAQLAKLVPEGADEDED